MSKDILLAAYCPHSVLSERVSINSNNRVFMRIDNPEVESDSIKLYANGTWIPKNGLSLPAQIISNIPLPIYLAAPVTLKIYLTNYTFEFTVPKGYITPQSFFNLISNNKFLAVGISNNVIVLTDKTGVSGSSSTLRVQGGELLGFPNTSTAGKEIFPSWKLFSTQPDNLGDSGVQVRNYLHFNKPIMSNPLFTVSYYTRQSNCHRCMGSGVENDYNFDIYGEVQLIENENLLYQACMKIILTELGSNPFHSWYGSSIQKVIGSKMITSLAGSIRKTVIDSLTRLQDTQKKQREFQVVSPSELLYRVSTVDVLFDEDNPQLITLDITVTNSSLTPINLTINYTSAQVAALFSGPDASLGI